MSKFPCYCCGYTTITERNHYEICPICFWEDDGSVDKEGYYITGANHQLLGEAQANFKEVGACDKRCLEFVRPPKSDEKYVGELKNFKERSREESHEELKKWYFANREKLGLEDGIF